MHKRKNTGPLAFDSVVATEGSFQWIPWAESRASLELTIAYVDSATDTTFGSCKVTEVLLSEETISAFKTFLGMVEKDFGKRVFDNVVAASSATGDPLPAASPFGLRGLGDS